MFEHRPLLPFVEQLFEIGELFVRSDLLHVTEQILLRIAQRIDDFVARGMS